MAITPQKITPCLWFDTKAEDAAKFYCAIFDNSRIGKISHFNEEGFEIHGKPAGSVMAVEFELDGQKFAALNGGPQFKFDEAISFQIHCKDQSEVNYYWEKLTTDGGQEGPCGWLKDKFGLSWQVVPDALFEMLTGNDHAASQRVTKAFLQMKKFDIAALRRAFEGDGMSTPQAFIISRTFKAPLERVWRAWTEPEPMAQWWGPKGFKAAIKTLDLRPGGMLHYLLASPQGQEMWGRFVYREVVPEKRLVYINSFSDESAGLTRHPLHEGWPLQLLTTVTFAEEDGKTTVTVRWEPYEATHAERDVFAAGHESMQGGWTGTLDRLEAYLAQA